MCKLQWLYNSCCFVCVESLSNGSNPKASRSGAGNVRPHRRGASLPSLDGTGDGKNRTSPKKPGMVLCSTVK